MNRLSAFLLLSSALCANAKSFLEAISTYPELSNFTSFVKDYEPVLRLSENAPLTVLVPSDNAFAAYKEKYGVEITDLPADQLAPLFNYHLLVGAQGKDNFTGPLGVTLPTFLTGPEYNNRTAGPALEDLTGSTDRSGGQVLFMSNSGSTGKLLVRQGGASTSVKSGLDTAVTLTIVEDSFDGGNFHILDGILTLPAPCSETIRNAKLTALDNALNRTGIWPNLNHAQNITCLAPSNDAFKAANDADSTFNETELTNALLFHTIMQPLYSSFLVDGMELTTLSNDTVRVSIKGSDIYFNNAKVIDRNVLVNNGLIHVLDSVMKPLDQISPSTSSASSTPTLMASSTVSATTTASSTVSASAAATSTGAAAIVSMPLQTWSMWSVLGAVMIFA